MRSGIMNQNTDIEMIVQRIDDLENELNRLKKSNILWGKKWFATGDSFTEGDFSNAATADHIIESGMYAGKKKTYPYIIGERNNMTVINEALCGSILPLSKHYTAHEEGADIDSRRPFTNTRYLKIPADVDYITLWFGINDSGHADLGAITDKTNETFYGAWNFILPYIIKNYPKAKLGVIVTNRGKAEFRRATRECCIKWGVPYLDMMGDYQIVPSTQGREFGMDLCDEAKELWNERFRITCVEGKSNGHPSAVWHEFQSSYIEAFLRSL